MKCIHCNHKLPDDSEFCQYCGNKIEVHITDGTTNESTDIVKKNTTDIRTTNEAKEVYDELEDSDIDNLTPEEAIKIFFDIQSKETIKDIEANIKNQPNHENDLDFGLVPEKPIYTLGTKLVDGEREFLSALRTSNGEKIKWERQGSTSVDGVNGMIDIYDIYLLSGQLYKTIYINMYGAKRSTKAPDGFILNDVTSQKSKKEKKVKTKYCSRCGSAINRQTKICTGCGRKYFKIRLNKFSVTIIILSVVIVALSALNIYQHTNSLQEKTEYEKTIQEQSDRIESKDARISSLEDKNTELLFENAKKMRAFNFYDTYAVIVADDGTRKYHKYGCDDLDDYSFWIYNINAAEGEGYYACSKCCN